MLSFVVRRCVFVFALSVSALLAQSSSLEELRETAAATWASRDWPSAQIALEALLAEEPQDADAWYRLGYCFHAQGKLDEALVAHKKATASERHGATATFNVACVHALRGEKELAIEWLDKAVDAGFSNWQHAEHDSDLSALHDDERFALLVHRMRSKAERKEMLVAIFIHDGVELLDFTGPGEVFASSRDQTGRAFRVVTVAPSKQLVTSQGFLKIEPTYTFENCPQPAIVVLPGGATGRALEHEGLIPWVKRVAPRAKVVMSVCTGALILAKADLLDGMEATTHFGSLAALRRVATGSTVREDLRIVDNGKIVTTAGISAGIDGALHVVARLIGREAALQCARYMEYRWVQDHFRSTSDADNRSKSAARSGESDRGSEIR